MEFATIIRTTKFESNVRVATVHLAQKPEVKYYVALGPTQPSIKGQIWTLWGLKPP